MIRFHRLLLALLVLFATAPSGRLIAASWQPVVEGIDYQFFHLAGPNRAHVARMDRDNPEIILETSIAKGYLAHGYETVSNMADRYDQALNSWEPAWGSRNQIVVAINGSFVEPEDGTPLSGIVHSGWYAKRFDDLGGGSGFAWKLDRSAFIGGCVAHPRGQQLVSLIRTGARLQIDAINRNRGADQLIVYTPQFGSRTPTGDGGVELLVLMAQPNMILTYPAMARGRVVAVRDQRGGTPIPFDHVVISASGSARDALLPNVEVGDEIGLSSHVRHYKPDCETLTGPDWQETYASLSGSFPFLQDGDIVSFDDLGARYRNPRTAICFNDEYLYFIVVDGRAEGWSVGMSMDELGAFCRDRLEAVWGINQDGGGSSTMWLDGRVLNRPSDGRERPVANGLMMVRVQPMERSERFAPGQPIQTNELVDLRLGPGDNYAGPWDVAEGTSGTILSHAGGLDGVLAKGSHWWLVDFGDISGWVPEESLAPYRGPAATPSPPPGITKSEPDSEDAGEPWQWHAARKPSNLLHWLP